MEMLTVEEIRSRLAVVFENEPIYKAILFGSYARDEATEDSDVDIVIDSRGDLLNMNFFGVLHDITELLGKKVDLIELAEVREDSPVLLELKERGVVLHEKQG
jgi:hypothetical protein